MALSALSKLIITIGFVEQVISAGYCMARGPLYSHDHLKQFENPAIEALSGP